LSQSWAIYNVLKSWTLYDLSEDEVKLLLITFSDNELKLTKICRKGDSKWDGVLNSTHHHLLGVSNKERYAKTELYPSLEFKGDPSVDTDIFKTTKIQYPRIHIRHESKITCKILGLADKVFATQTLDLSDGGLSFTEALPDWVAGYFLVSVDGKFELMCSIVEDQKERTRVQIACDENDPHYVGYKAWLLTL
jgi:hypothetical protein